jgi:hypothetical protein
MGWAVAAVMLAIVFLLIVLYRRALNDTNHLFSLVVLILLDPSVYESQKSGLISFVNSTSANNAALLSSSVFSSMTDLANRLAKTSVLGAHAALWKVRQEARGG